MKLEWSRLRSPISTVSRIFFTIAIRSLRSWCWLLRHDGKLLDDVAGILDLRDGLPVTLR